MKVGLVARSEAGQWVGKYSIYPEGGGIRLAQGGGRVRGYAKKSLNGQPLVTVITVCFNSAGTLQQCMDSVFDQTYGNIEYIIVDGASTDGTVDLLRANEERIDYYVSEKDAGLYQAMNKGLELAAGDYILLLNSDDWYEQDCVEILLAAKVRTGADFISGLARMVDEKGEFIRNIRSMPFDAATRLRMPLRHETMLVPSSVYRAVGPYNDNYRVIADYDFTLRLFETGFVHYEIPLVLMSFRNTGVSTRNLERVTRDRVNLLSSEFPMLSGSEVRILAEHGRLDPQSLLDLLGKYASCTSLMEALHAYVIHQRALGNKRWFDFDVSVFSTVIGTGSIYMPLKGPATAVKVATLCSMDHGGAGVGTQRRVEALRNLGVDARIYSLVVKSAHNYVHRISPSNPSINAADQNSVWEEVRKRAITPVWQEPGHKARELFSLPSSVLSFAELDNATESADVIHMHWVVGMLDYAALGERWPCRPLVWTLADMNAFTGGCHYSEGCEEYVRECRSCHLLGAGSNLAHKVWKTKRKAYDKLKNLSVVCPTRWIADKVRQSSLLGNRPIHYIPNAFPVERFSMHNKVLARLALGLPLDKKIMLFAADSLTNQRKGALGLKQALQVFAKSHSVRDCLIVVFGSSNISLPIAVRSMGYVNDDYQLSMIYSAADVFLSTTVEDSGPMTVGESLCCGTPVISFNVGYAPDIIEHGETGYIAKIGDHVDFASGIGWAFSTEPEEALSRSLKCRISGARFHDPSVSATRHLSLYRSVLAASCF